MTTNSTTTFPHRPELATLANARSPQFFVPTMTETSSFPFPHTELTPSLANSRRPFVSLQLLQAELQSNTESVPSIRGNGAINSALTMSATDFLLTSGNIPLDPPVHSGAAPDHPAAATAPIITALNRHFFLADQTEFTVSSTSVKSHLTLHLLKAVPELYIEALRQPTKKFSRLSVLAIKLWRHRPRAKPPPPDLPLMVLPVTEITLKTATPAAEDQTAPLLRVVPTAEPATTCQNQRTQNVPPPTTAAARSARRDSTLLRRQTLGRLLFPSIFPRRITGRSALLIFLSTSHNILII